MFVGHVGVGLALKRAAPGVNAGILVAAALLLDGLLGVFVLSGLEEVHVPDDFASRHYLTFTFPFSHGLLATLLWAALAAAVAWAALPRRVRHLGALVVAVAVASHFLCDVTEHVPELPLAGTGSPVLGLGLWRWLPFALALEVALAALGLFLYARSVGGGFPWGMALLLLTVTAVAVPGQLLGRTVPPAHTLAWTWLVQLVVLGLWAGLLDARAPRRLGRHVSSGGLAS